MRPQRAIPEPLAAFLSAAEQGTVEAPTPMHTPRKRKRRDIEQLAEAVRADERQAAAWRNYGLRPDDIVLL
ncbi:MAG: hypothetical protein K8U57_12625 [Planctomycetes bacterium]|nr:hypothetical protein [Planctomycetota bacterium]